MTPRLIAGMTGASGAIYGVRLLERLRELPVETHLVDSPNIFESRRRRV
jgi:4-hydroxy-3-polyprenylbenzoate decarboxylase